MAPISSYFCRFFYADLFNAYGTFYFLQTNALPAAQKKLLWILKKNAAAAGTTFEHLNRHPKSIDSSNLKAILNIFIVHLKSFKNQRPRKTSNMKIVQQYVQSKAERIE